MMEHQARKLLTQPDGRVAQMLAEPRGYFARARERARADVEREIASRARRARAR